MPPPLNTLWIGPRLGAVERACLRSALRQGHAVRLWCYSIPEGVPEGVELHEAAGIVPQDRVIRHRGGSYSLFSNLFRYVLQQRGLGTWIDADLYFVAPLDGERPWLFAMESEGLANTAVLRTPAEAPVLAPLIALFDEREVPFWLPWRARIEAWLRLRRTGRTGLADMPWGSAGPKAFTALARREGLLGRALARETFYPVPWQEAGWIRDPALRLDDVLAPGTVAVHLWNECIRSFKDAPAPAGSFLARLQEEGA